MQWLAWAVEREKQGAREGLLLVCADPPEEVSRTPVILNLVLDRSGSMKGAPLAAAIEAAQQVVDSASADDFVGLCLFDARPEQRVPLTPMDAAGKKRMHEALSQIAAGTGTALHGAVRLAAEEANRVFASGRKPRLLLLTDGEPSEGPESVSEFQSLGREVADAGVKVHALGLAGHYLPEILAALTVPSGNGFAHVDGPDGLSVAMGQVFSSLHGEVASDAAVRVEPRGFRALFCRHAYSTRQEREGLIASLGSLCAGQPRRILFSGQLQEPDWSIAVTGSCLERGDQRHQSVQVQRVWPDSPEGRLTIAIGAELELVNAETSAWGALSRKDRDRAQDRLEFAEARLRELVVLNAAGIPVRRHLDRLAELRLALEQGVGDLRLLSRRSESVSTVTRVSQILRDPRLRN